VLLCRFIRRRRRTCLEGHIVVGCMDIKAAIEGKMKIGRAYERFEKHPEAAFNLNAARLGNWVKWKSRFRPASSLLKSFRNSGPCRVSEAILQDSAKLPIFLPLRQKRRSNCSKCRRSEQLAHKGCDVQYSLILDGCQPNRTSPLVNAIRSSTEYMTGPDKFVCVLAKICKAMSIRTPNVTKKKSNN